MYFCPFLYLSLKDIYVNICKALLCNGIKLLLLLLLLIKKTFSPK